MENYEGDDYYENGEEGDEEDNVDIVDANDSGLNLKDPIFDYITVEDVLNMTYDIVDGAEAFYNIYSASGAHKNVSFTAKGLYNLLDMRRREQIIDGDAQSAIGYLVAKQDRNPLLFQKYYMGDKGLEDNKWVKWAHRCWDRWAECYLRGYFFGGVQAS
ncbi:hypothetical protein M9H77_17621 [Catharanthus roseus]|uniref:Uncharacterized protein n=1 Tax=Catharanthus roseus TaxID=4058 RepID=A0ACC0B564_CATRO|nr:hypothetical protein M9H77_17621 [Catharanthus roseus]